MLQQYLPFWLAVLAQQLLVLMIPVLGVIYPLLRFAPALYGWGMRRRIVMLYGQLKLLEYELDGRPAEADTKDLFARFEMLEKRANSMRVPASFAHLLYTLRQHLDLVRRRLEQREGPLTL